MQLFSVWNNSVGEGASADRSWIIISGKRYIAKDECAATFNQFTCGNNICVAGRTHKSSVLTDSCAVTVFAHTKVADKHHTGVDQRHKCLSAYYAA